MILPPIWGNQYNIGHICTRQQCESGLADKIAMRFVAPNCEARYYTFAVLERESNRFANAMRGLGFQPGDVFFTFLPKMEEQFFSFLGALKLQLVTGTLFANFGEEALLDRLGDARAKGILTKKSFIKKLSRIRDRLSDLRWIIVVDDEEDHGRDMLSYRRLMAAASDEFTALPTDPDVPSVLHYTSGSTGKPKGVLHRHKSILHQYITTTDVLGLQRDDIFWCTADQGWITGTSYGIIGPWSHGISQIHYSGGYDAEKWFHLLESEQV